MKVALAFVSLCVCACSAPGEPVDATDAAPDVAPMDAALGVDALDEVTPADAKMDVDSGPTVTCTKTLTVLFSVGTGAGALASHASGCWTVLDADGAANKSFRKCSTGQGVVQNPSASNYAFDDTNPNNSLSQQQSFMQQCSAGATGDGFEYMAYRGSWRLIYPATHLRAFFAELYSSDDYVDDDWPSAYVGNAQLANHTVYPMINISPTNGPSPENKIKTDGLAICKKIADKGYFGVYVATWNQPMTSNDARIVALANTLDACTMK